MKTHTTLIWGSCCLPHSRSLVQCFNISNCDLSLKIFQHWTSWIHKKQGSGGKLSFCQFTQSLKSRLGKEVPEKVSSFAFIYCMLCVYFNLNVFACGLECMCINHVCAEAGKGQKVSYPLELEWQILVGARSFPRAASASYCWPISPAPKTILRQALTPTPG